MCGITGVYGLSDTQSNNTHSIDLMLSKIKHRGPDADGYFSSETGDIVWGHCRLSIMDPEGGDQPIYSEDGSISVVANGEIYNSKEIRLQLTTDLSEIDTMNSIDKKDTEGSVPLKLPKRVAAHHFSTTSDTECILHLYEEYGTDLLKYIDGMYTFAIIDSNQPYGRQIMVARDPIGIKPLYYAKQAGRVWFTSEAKSLADGKPDKKDSPPASTINPTSEFATRANAKHAAAIQIQEFPPGHYYIPEKGFVSFYKVPDLQPSEDTDPQNYIRQVRRTLEASIEKRLMSDVPLGCFLSGGLDSSIITAVARRIVGRPIHSFSVGYEDSPDLLAARSLATTLDTIHHEFVITDQAIRQHLRDIIYYLESFDQDLVRSAIPTYFTSRLAAEHVKVILTGEGADELFAGYTYYKDIDETEEYLHHELRRSVKNLHNINLQRVDRLTMAHSIEGRVPFLDLEMIKLAQKIPAEYKLYGNPPMEKWVLRKAFEDMLPEEILWRRKEQFDEGSGTADIMPRLAAEAMSDNEYQHHIAQNSRLQLRSKEEAYYHRLFDRVYENSCSVLETVGRWTDRPEWI